MVRPRADNYDERRQSILDGAAEMFAQHGYDGTSIATIARHLGVSNALLYHYYQSKEALLFDILNLHCQLLADTAVSAAKTETVPEKQLQAVVRALMRLYATSREKHVVLFNNLHCLSLPQQKQIKDLEKKVVQVIKDLLAKLQPHLKPTARSAMAMYLMGAINWTYTWFQSRGAVSEKEFADLATSLFLNGINNSPA